MEEVLQAYGRFYQDVSERGMFQGGDPVQPSSTATTVRRRNGSTQTAAGPFTNGQDQLSGFYVLDCKDRDEAVTYAAKIPAASAGAVEVRPIAQT
jgi:hypothetical protein